MCTTYSRSSYTVHTFWFHHIALTSQFAHHWEPPTEIESRNVSRSALAHTHTLNYTYRINCLCCLVQRLKERNKAQWNNQRINRIQFPFFIYCLLYCFSNRFGITQELNIAKIGKSTMIQWVSPIRKHSSGILRCFLPFRVFICLFFPQLDV